MDEFCWILMVTWAIENISEVKVSHTVLISAHTFILLIFRLHLEGSDERLLANRMTQTAMCQCAPYTGSFASCL